VSHAKEEPRGGSSGRKVRGSVLGAVSFVWLSLGFLLWGPPALAQSQEPPPGAKASAAQQSPVPNLSGSIGGTVVDPSGASIATAHVQLTSENQTANQEVLSDEHGQFFFPNVAPGPFQLTIGAEGFTAQVFSGILHPRETYVTPQIGLTVATATTEMQVNLPQVEVAEAQLREMETQRVLGIVPNFYASYIPKAAPLTPKQKFQLAWRTTVDPVTIVLTGAVAGIQQANNEYSGYGQGAQGYGKRFGASYANLVTGTFIGSAILPSLLKQDPRYFYKGTGSKQSRILYAIANSVICKGDNGRWEANYSSILGSFAAAGISNLYYPASNRHGPELTFEGTLIGVGATALANLLQEFALRKLTSHVPNYDPAKP
jgi:hypothetical protein